MAGTVEFSEEAKAVLDDFSPGGQSRLEGILKAHAKGSAGPSHFHGVGMCVLMEAGPDGIIRVKKMSPFCLKPT